MDLRKDEKLPETKIKTDSYISVQLIDKKNTLSFDSLKFMAEKVEGSFCFTVLNDKNELYIIKQDNPIALYDFGGFYVYASTEYILNKALRKLKIKNSYEKIKICCGDMIKIGIDGKIEKCIFDAMRFDFMKYRRNYGLYYYDFDWDTRYNENNLQKVYYDELVDFAKSVGVSEEEIESLISMGLDCFDIEELLYEPQVLNYYLYGIDEDDDLI